MFVAAERERKISRSSNIRNNVNSLKHEKCLPKIVSEKTCLQPKVSLAAGPRVTTKEPPRQFRNNKNFSNYQIETDHLKISTVVVDGGGGGTYQTQISNGVHLPPLRVANLPVKFKSIKNPNCINRSDSYFVPILVPKRDDTSSSVICKSIESSSIANCCKENERVFPVKPKPQRLVPLTRQKALEDHSTPILRANEGPCLTLSNTYCLVDAVTTVSRHRTSKPKKSLRGEFTHFPSFWKIFPAKPSPTILPPLAGFFQSIPNKSSRRTNNKMATSPTLDQTVPTMMTPTVLINHDLLTNGDEDSQEGLSPVLVPTVVSRPPFVHTVSIVVEPVTDSMCDGSSMDEPDTDEFSSTEIDDDLAGKSVTNEDLVKTVMDHARLRKEEFARLLEEHAQIVNEINKAENKMV